MSTEAESKKWIINRMESLLKVTIQDINTREQVIENFATRVLDGVHKARNIFMGITGVVISIILALMASNRIDSPIFEWSLAITIGSGAFIFFSITLVMKGYNKLFMPIQLSFIPARDVIQRLQGRIIDDTLMLDKISYEKLTIYYEYCTIALMPTIAIVLKSIEDAKTSSRYFKNLKKPLNEVEKKLKRGLEAGRQLYQKNEEGFKKHGFLEGTYLDILEPALKYLKSDKPIIKID